MKINQIITVFVLALLALACGNSSEEIEVADGPAFTIEAKIDSLDYKMAYLSQYKDGDFVNLDSATIKEGSFSFAGSVQSPNVQYILFDDSDQRIVVFVENSEISITGSKIGADDLTVSGSVIHSQLKAFNEASEVYNDKLKAIVDDYHTAEENGDDALVEVLSAKYDNEDSLKGVFIEGYIHENLNSVIAPYLSLRYMMNRDVEELEELKNSFADDLTDSEYVQKISERIVVVKNTTIGQPAPTFTMNDKDGNPITLESFKGKYVLVDFWASWCGPCRRENPNVVAAYKKFHKKGFEIFGVSFDTDKRKWVNAVKEDDLTWSHVSDLQGWGNAAGKLYGVRSIPHSVLIDKEGIIIAKDLRGEELHEKLEEIFAELAVK